MPELGRLAADDYRELEKLPVAVVLDEVRSGLNVGSVFRSSDAFLVEKILLCGITAQPPHREILKTALGSTESVQWEYVAQTTEAISALKQQGYTVLAVEQIHGSTLLDVFEPTPGARYALVFGNEVDGVSEAALSLCDGALEIPQFGTKHSLNIAVAAGIVLWEVTKKLRMRL